MIEEDVLELRDYRYFENIKPEKDYLVKNLLPVKSLIMLFSPPACFKSIVAQYIATCICSGRKCFGCKSKIKGVLICDRENNDNIIADRLKKIRRGLRIRKKDVPLYYLPRNEGDLLNEEFIDRLDSTIKLNNISLVIFDTLHRYGDYQENSADDLSKLYTKCFSPLIDKRDISILFLHHTTKSRRGKGNFRGTGDFEGMCDVVYEIIRKDKTNYFTLNNTKNRTGELEETNAMIDFLDKQILIEKTDLPKIIITNVLGDLKKKIMTYFSESHITLRRYEIEELLNKDKYNYSETSLKRGLNQLVEDNKLRRISKKEGYTTVTK